MTDGMSEREENPAPTITQIHVRDDGVETWIDDKGHILRWYPGVSQWSYATFRECRVNEQARLHVARVLVVLA